MKKIYYFILIILIIILLICLFRNKIEFFKEGADCSICDTLTTLYKDTGLLFRGLECDITEDDANNQQCIVKEIEGPHEPCFLDDPPCNVAKNQGATTFLKTGMNPFFYFDIGGTDNLVLLYNTSIVTKKSCGFNQDAGGNGCSHGESCDSNTNYFNKYATSALDGLCKPTGGLCKYNNNNNDLLTDFSKFESVYNNYMNNFIDGYTKNNPSGIKAQIDGGCAVMKENQVSSFWDSKSAITGGALLAIGIIITEGKNPTDAAKDYNKSYNEAVKVQKLITTKYTKKFSIVKVYRPVNKDIKPVIGKNGKYYMAKFDDLQFMKAPLPPPPPPPPPQPLACSPPKCLASCVKVPPTCSVQKDCINWANTNLKCKGEANGSYCNASNVCHFIFK